MRNIKHLVVHCTATSQKATLAGIRNGWRQRGWKNPGYHILIFPNGADIRLLPDDQISNGVAGHNSTSLHVSYVGGIDEQGKPVDNRTPAQKEALVRVLTAWRELYPNAKIQGHRDFSPDTNHNGKIDTWEYIKYCPCFNAIPEYAHI